MGLWTRHILPHLIDRMCGVRSVTRQRQKVIPRARGEVLELGFGSGMNLAYYDPGRVTAIHAIEPSEAMSRRAVPAIAASAIPVHLHDAPAESLPFADASVDTVVSTYTLCSLADVPRALAEVRRVLRPGGELLFIEHGLAPDADVRRWQTRLTPAWCRMAGGCHLDRDVPALLAAAGFTLPWLETLYLPGWRWLNYNYWGAACPRQRVAEQRA